MLCKLLYVNHIIYWNGSCLWYNNCRFCYFILLFPARLTPNTLPATEQIITVTSLSKVSSEKLPPSANPTIVIAAKIPSPMMTPILIPSFLFSFPAFAAAQNVTIITYNKEGVVTEHPDDKWALRECFTCKLPMTGVDDLAKYVDYPICKQHLILFVYSSFIKKPPQITC